MSQNLKQFLQYPVTYIDAPEQDWRAGTGYPGQGKQECKERIDLLNHPLHTSGQLEKKRPIPLHTQPRLERHCP
jgi:hypothetical protein